MADYARVSVTFKAGAGYEQPWVVFHGETADEVGAEIAAFRNRGLFTAVRDTAVEFQAGKAGAAVVAAAFPNAEPVAEHRSGFANERRWDEPAATYSDGRQIDPPAVASYPQQSQAPVQQGNLNPQCGVCGSATEYKSGTGAKGPWQAYFCLATKGAPRGQGHAPNWVK